MDLSAALDAPSTLTRRRVDREAGRLVASRCEACGTLSWPGRAVCHRCGAAGTVNVLLSDAGTLVTYTTVWVPRPGLEPPFTLGQVDIADGVRVFAHVRDLRDGDRVPLPVVLAVAPGESDVPPFWFVPERGA